MTRSYYEDFGPPSLRVQDLVIMDTHVRIEPLLRAIAKVPGISWDETEVIQTVMQCIQYEHRALSALHDKCLQLVGQCTGTSRYDMVVSPEGWKKVGYSRDPDASVPWLNESVQIAGLLTELGMFLFTTLRMMGCYTNGYLFYQFKDWLGYDMVLQRFEVDTRGLT